MMVVCGLFSWQEWLLLLRCNYENVDRSETVVSGKAVEARECGAGFR